MFVPTNAPTKEFVKLNLNDTEKKNEGYIKNQKKDH